MPNCHNAAAERGSLASRWLGGLALSALAMPSLALPVIPGAAGFGITTPAGRGGTVYRVTNRNDTGSGSLRACVEASGPRVCVFEVSGVIRLSSWLKITNPKITIAGQTAPSPGIMVRGHFRVEAPDVLVQHLTILRGDDSVERGLTFSGNNFSGTTATNVVLDHLTIGWGTGTTFSFYYGFGDVSLINSIVTEGLNDSPGNEYEGYGLILGPMAGSRMSIIGTLFAHNSERNPLSKNSELAFVNNLVYNWVKDATRFSNEAAFGSDGQLLTTKNSVVGNLYILGPSFGAISGGQSVPIWFDYTMAGSGNQAYLADNAMANSALTAPVPPSDPWSLATISSPNSRSSLEVRNPPTWPSGLFARPVGQVRDYVLANAGSRPADRSARDAKLISDVRNGTGSFIHCVNPSSYYSGSGWITENVPNCDRRNAGGWPVYAQNSRRLTLPENPNADDDGDGYTNLEEWLQQMAAEVEGRAIASSPTPPNSVVVQ